ncbi:DegT/DnrJ/EryC1/StrS family aminotransferase [Brucella pseudogrignonensis]|jgi:dTDP-4-amino-4,6-dideoxygalactose transaminase|uniref:DegT/DnrJ/EryC1/StrS family aminotransferase n=1 Tax=Brucella pseudogrignonensis TaxID=419475 RepID=UPI001E321525|nr:DegT/DnrJ/EryC1/StrS family aminotransferase [Brucella pseudogrignonensis]MCD4510015.1 DegT/DnrJ/EryC1/StrS family aminotransferase [Brucella pseudogrignonensis]
MNVPFVDFKTALHAMRNDMSTACDNVAAGGNLILGSELSAFEKEFADYSDASFCVGVANGLEAISLSLRALGIGPGDEVIVPSQTFVATWLAVSHVGAVPLEVDVEADTVLIDTDKIESVITPKTRAIIPVHLFGQSVNMSRILEIARRHNLYVVEDAAQAHGARYKGARVGSFGDLAAFSFYPTKNLGAAGDGGAIITQSAELAAKLRRLRNYGSEQKYYHQEVGYNSRLDELQAAYLRIKLRRLDDENMRRRRAAQYYIDKLKNVPSVRLLKQERDREHVFHLFVIMVKARDQVLEKMRALGIDVAVHYPITPGDQLAYGRKADRVTCISGRQAADEGLSLPIWPDITTAQQDSVIHALCQAIG